MATIGENIKKLRIENGMSQQNLADALGKSRSAVSMYESGEIIPRMGVIEKMAGLFLVRKSEILGEAEKYGELSAEDKAVLDMYRKLPEKQREAIRSMMAAMAGE